jgi:hypothetical protein
MTSEIIEYVDQLPLLDHHVHGVFKSDPTVEQFANMITESDRQPKSIELAMNSQVGFATRKWCSPLIDLPAHADPQTYFDRRMQLGAEEVNRRMLKASGITYSLIETGYRGDEIHGPAAMSQLSESRVDEIIRLETTAEKMLDAGATTAESFICANKTRSSNGNCRCLKRCSRW